MRERRSPRSASLVGLVSIFPILLRVLPPIAMDALTQERDPNYLAMVVGLVLYVALVAGVVVLLSL